MPMPRSFLITNRRYGDLSPPPVSTFDSPSLLASSGLSLLFPHQFTSHLTNQLVLSDEIQEEAEDLSMKKHKKVSSLSSSSSSTVSVVNESKELIVPPSPFTKNSDAGSDGDSHLCPDCGKCYSTSSNLARHRQTHRSVTDQKARKCPHCEKVYVSSPAYSMHVRTHSQGCQVISIKISSFTFILHFLFIFSVSILWQMLLSPVAITRSHSNSYR